jgi:hypothetical protein
MDTVGFKEWTWNVPEDDKRALAARIAEVRGAVKNIPFLEQARADAQHVIAGNRFYPSAVNPSAPTGSVEEVYFTRGRDVPAPTPDDDVDLQGAYDDVLLALGASFEITALQRRVLACSLLPEVPGLSGALGLSWPRPV